MRSLKLASFASLFLALSLSACTVGGDDGENGNPPPAGGQPDAGPGGGGGGNPDAAPPALKTCPPSEADFKTATFDVALLSCAQQCHGGGAGGFKLSTTDMAANLTASTAEAKKKAANGASILLAKPTNEAPHGGNVQFAAGSTQYKALEKFVGQVTGTPAVCP